MLDDSITSELEKPLPTHAVKSRQQAGQQLSYIEGWYAVAELNRIFGHGGWTRETLELTNVVEAERTIGSQKKPGHAVTYRARVRVTVIAGDQAIVRDGCGAGHGVAQDLGEAHESALKEAETDALKRAACTLGWPLGLALYDGSRAHVGGANGQPAKPQQPQNPASGPSKTLRLHTPDGSYREYEYSQQGARDAVADAENEPSFALANVEWLQRLASKPSTPKDIAERAEQALAPLQKQEAAE